MKSPNQDPNKPRTQLIDCVLFALIPVGAISAIGGVAAMADSNDYTGGGILMLAAACSFGLLGNALLRR